MRRSVQAVPGSIALRSLCRFAVATLFVAALSVATVPCARAQTPPETVLAAGDIADCHKTLVASALYRAFGLIYDPGVRSRTSFRSGSARDEADAYLAQGRERGAGDGRGEKRKRPALHGPGRIARLT
jgi:hypothetical protein